MYRIVKALGLAIVIGGTCAFATAASGETSTRVAAAPAAAPLSGEWHGSLTDPQGGQHPVTLILKVDNDVVTGSLAGGPPDGSTQPLSEGKLSGDRISFKLKLSGPGGEAFVLNFAGKVSGNRISGMHGLEGDSFPWEVTKK